MSTREKRGPLALEAWAKHHIDGYKNCSIRNMTTSWRNGLAFCALIHRFRPDLINYEELNPEDILGNCSLAFEVAERQFGIPALLDPMDMLALEVPDRLSVLTYVAQYYNAFKKLEMKSTSPKHQSHHNLEDSLVNSTSSQSSNLDKKNHPTKRTLDIEDDALNEARKRLSGNSSPVMLRNKATCSVCQNPVYISERILFNKKLYHKSCFRCFNCNHVLNPQTADISADGLLFCLENTCFVEIQKRSRESKLNVTSSSSVNINPSADCVFQGNENGKKSVELQDVPKIDADESTLEIVSGMQSSSSSEKIHTTKIRFDETVEIKSSSEDVISKVNEVKLKTAESTEEIPSDIFINEPERETSDIAIIEPEEDPSDIHVLIPNSSLVSNLKQRDEAEMLRQNTAANEITIKSEENRQNRTSSGVDVKKTHEMPNIYSESVLPVGERITRTLPKLKNKDNKKNNFLNEMLEESKVEPKTEKPEISESESNPIPIVVEEDTVQPQVIQKIKSRSPSPKRKSNGDTNLAPVDLVEKIKTLISPSPDSGLSPVPSPTPRRKSPVPSTSSTFSVSDTSTNPSPSPRRVKSKPPRPKQPSQTSLISVSARGAVPSAKELWKKENYYPSELNPFESEDNIQTDSSSQANIVPSNPFEDDEDEIEPSPLPSPRPSPRIRSARNQVNSINQQRNRSQSRSRSRSKSPPQPAVRSVANINVLKFEPKPYNPFEDDNEDANELSVGDTDESGIFIQQSPLSREDGEETSSTASSVSGPVPKVRQSLLSTTSSCEGGTMKLKSSKSKRAPLPPAHSFTATPTNPGMSKTPPSTPPKSPKSILKSPHQSQSVANTNGSPGGRKKVIPASPDLLKGLKNPGQYKKKRRAPPPRRRVEPLPEGAIRTELNDLVVKEREFERQGITLESTIRRLMDQETTSNDDSNGNPCNEQQLDEMMIQLWNIVNEKNEILRRQTELEYLLRGHHLEEMQAEREFKLRVLMDTPINERQDDYAQVEQVLLDELFKLVDERNEVVDWLDFHRKQEHEEDELVSNTLTSYSTASLQRQKENSSNSPVPLIISPDSEKSKTSRSKKDKHKQKEKDKVKDKASKEQKVKDNTYKDEKEKKFKMKMPSLFGKKKNKSFKNSQDDTNNTENGHNLTDNDNIVAGDAKN